MNTIDATPIYASTIDFAGRAVINAFANEGKPTIIKVRGVNYTFAFSDYNEHGVMVAFHYRSEDGKFLSFTNFFPVYFDEWDGARCGYLKETCWMNDEHNTMMVVPSGR